jgi:RNA polymerase sigma factor (sigma-70 family)
VLERSIQASELSIADLLERMRRGDRDALAEFITRYGPRIRQRVRRRLAPSARRLFDSTEVLSTVARRLDHVVRERRMTASSESELWSLVLRVVERSVIDKGRAFRRLQRMEGEDAPLAAEVLSRMRQGEERAADPDLDLADIFEMVNEGSDREILGLWMRGLQPTSIARVLGLPPGTVRRRWHTLRNELRARLAEANG